MDQSGGSTPPSGQSTPPPSPQQGWQSTPQPPGAPPPAGGQPGGMPSWSSNLTARGTLVGPAGVALADLPERIIAWVIDAIIITVIGFIVSILTTSLLGDNFFVFRTASLVSTILAVVIMLAVTAGYFIYMWSRMGGATVGQKLLKLSVRDAASGRPIGQQQAITRWLVLGAPLAIFWGLYGYGIFWLLAAIALAAWEIYLLVTTAQSPTRQGFHDTYAKTVVAKG